MARVAYAGAASGAVDFAVFNALLAWVADPAITFDVLAANTVAFGCAMVVSYTLNARFSFVVRVSRRSVLAYVLFTALGLVFHNFNLWWIRALLGADDALMVNASKLSAMGLLVVWNYVGYQRFVFRAPATDVKGS